MDSGESVLAIPRKVRCIAHFISHVGEGIKETHAFDKRFKCGCNNVLTSDGKRTKFHSNPFHARYKEYLWVQHSLISITLRNSTGVPISLAEMRFYKI
jgi:hypothetical protein